MERTITVDGIEYVVSKQATTKDTVTIKFKQKSLPQKIVYAKIRSWQEYKQILCLEINDKLYKIKITAGVFNSFDLHSFTHKISHKIVCNSLAYTCNKPQPFIVPSRRSSTTQKSIPKNSFSYGKQELKSPLAGYVIKIFVKEKQIVKKNQPLIVIESMKMENEICAESNAIIKKLLISEENLVQPNQVLIVFE
jgi:biotin carboxyl carrier protein